MKRVSYFAAIVFTAILAVCCSKNNSQKDDPTVEGDGAVTVSLDVDGMKTKADVTDSSLQSVQILMYLTQPTELKGYLYRYYRFTSAELAAKKARIEKVNEGAYDIVVLANAPDLEGKEFTISLSGLLNGTFPIDSNDINKAGLMMYGTGNNGSGSTVTVDLRRYVADIHLNTIKNDIPEAYGSLRVTNIYITNVVAASYYDIDYAWSSGSSTHAEVWYHKEGRYTKGGTIVKTELVNEEAGHTQAKDLTFWRYDATINYGAIADCDHSFYACKNQADVSPLDFVETFSAQRTCLVVEAVFGKDGAYQRYYYPIVITEVLPNTRYNVDLTIKGAGSDDPNKPVGKQALNATVKISPWENGADYKEEI